MIFSIIVPVCNAQTFLVEAVESAVNQKIDTKGADKSSIYEIILLENGSKDSSPAVCDELAGKYDNVRAIHKGRIGLYAARQYGIREAAGDYILALDADDCMAEDCLLRLMAALDECKKKYDGRTPDLIIYDADRLGGDGKPLFERRGLEEGRLYRGDDKKVFFDSFCTDDSLNSMWTKCVKRSIAGLEKPDIFLNYGEDLYQTAAYLDRADGVMYLGEVLYHYRTDAPSMSSGYSEVYIDNQKITWSGLDEVSSKWEGTSFDDIIRRRKSLTCTIAMTKLIYSGMSMSEKKRKLDKLLDDPFYKEYSSYPLPDWAPEESVFVKELQMRKDSRSALLRNAFIRGIKSGIKTKIRKD